MSREDPHRSRSGPSYAPAHEATLHGLLVQEEDPRARQIALLVAILLHGLAITVTLPSFGRPELPAAPEPVRMPYNSLPIPPPPERERIAEVETTDLDARLVPAPDPTPEEPEPVVEPAPELVLPAVIAGPMAAPMGEPAPPPAAMPLFPGIGDVSYPVLIPGTRVRPDYPRSARRAHAEGRVILQAVILRDGSVGEVDVIRCTKPTFGFEAAAIEAVRMWRYTPGFQNGRPVSVYITIVVDFALE
jgi:protein TonB